MSLFSRVVVLTLPLVPKFVVGQVAKKYVAGETREEALDEVAALNASGAMATLDVLGEEVSERSKATRTSDELRPRRRRMATSCESTWKTARSPTRR
jgi:proline dehydrogenase